MLPHMRPDALAAELGITGRSLRRWLRNTYPRGDADFHMAWHMTDAQVAAARKRFADPARRATTREGYVTTLVALEGPQFRKLKRVCEARNIAMTEAVRRAVRAWLEQGKP